MFAQFHETEAEAREALAAWARGIREDWVLTEPREVLRAPEVLAEFGQWSAGIVPPVQRPRVLGRTLRVLRQEAGGLWSRVGEPYQGTSRVAFEVCYPEV